jgi:hypothetical protein
MSSSALAKAIRFTWMTCNNTVYKKFLLAPPVLFYACDQPHGGKWIAKFGT